VNADVLRLYEVSIRRGERSILSAATLSVARGELVALMGPSGSGKTTLLRAVAALDPFESGVIEVDGVRLEPGRPANGQMAALRRKVGMVFQFHYLFEHLSVLKNVCLAPVYAHGVKAADAERRARELLQSLGVDHRAEALPRELSGGEAQRVAIARTLAVDPPLVLMDEPTASLDHARKAEVGTLLRRLVDAHRTLVVATHDDEFARHWADRVVRVETGQLL
jgi:ABC-type polar amino acid transport system ATPase subunit